MPERITTYYHCYHTISTIETHKGSCHRLSDCCSRVVEYQCSLNQREFSSPASVQFNKPTAVGTSPVSIITLRIQITFGMALSRTIRITLVQKLTGKPPGYSGRSELLDPHHQC